MANETIARNADATKKRPADEAIDPDVAGFIKMGLKGVKKLQNELGFVVSGDPYGDGVARVTRAIHTIRESLLGIRRELRGEYASSEDEPEANKGIDRKLGDVIGAVATAQCTLGTIRTDDADTAAELVAIVRALHAVDVRVQGVWPKLTDDKDGAS